MIRRIKLKPKIIDKFVDLFIQKYESIVAIHNESKESIEEWEEYLQKHNITKYNKRNKTQNFSYIVFAGYQIPEDFIEKAVVLGSLP